MAGVVFSGVAAMVAVVTSAQLLDVVGHRPLHGRGTKWLFLRFESI